MAEAGRRQWQQWHAVRLPLQDVGELDSHVGSWAAASAARHRSGQLGSSGGSTGGVMSSG